MARATSGRTPHGDAAAAPPGASRTGGSAIKRLKASLKSAGVIGPQARVRKVSKHGSQKSKVAAAAARLETRSVLRSMASKSIDTNPFELKFARQKHTVMGKKLPKGAVGRPGLTRKKSEEVRRNTLLVEMRRGNRSSEVVDRRIGENDPTMSVEDKMLQRLMREKSGKAARGNLFNLEDDEELTHMGRSLADADAFDDAGLERVRTGRGNNDDDDEDDGRITRDTVNRAHFGGFDDDDNDENADTCHKSHREIMKEVVSKSKQHKRERQMQKEQDAGLCDELDAELDELRGLLEPMDSRRERFSYATSANSIPVSQPASKNAAAATTTTAASASAPATATVTADQDYDRVFREMMFDRRARPTDRTKTEEELALAEKQKLEKLEADRIRRMKGIASDDDSSDTDNDSDDGGSDTGPSSSKTIKKSKTDRHRHAQGDDLDADDYEAYLDQAVAAENEMPLTYRDGVLVNDTIFVKKRKGGSRDEEDSDEEEDDDDDEEEEEDDEDDEEDDEDDEDADVSQEKDSDSESQVALSRAEREGSLEPDFEMPTGNDDDDEADDDDDDDSKRDTAYESYFDSDDKDNADIDGEIQAPFAHLDGDQDAKTSAVQDQDHHDDDEDDIPYVPKAPATLDDFIELVDGKSPQAKATIVKRLRILNNPKLGPESAKRLEQLAVILIEYRDHVLAPKRSDMATLTALEGHTVELGRQYSAAVAEHALNRIAEIQTSLETTLAKGKASKVSGFPTLAELYFFRVIGEIYSTSDKHHVVATPTMLVMSQMLAECSIRTGQDAVSGLFLCEVYLDYVHVSRRFVPEIVNFAHRLLASLLGKSGSQIPVIVPQPEKVNTSVLAISDMKAEPVELRVSRLHTLAKPGALTEHIKTALLVQNVHLLSKCARMWNETGSVIELFTLTIDLIDTLTDTGLSDSAREAIRAHTASIHANIASAGLKRRPLQLQKRKSIPIPTYMPKFDMGYNHERRGRQDPDRERSEAAKLRNQFKQEHKGAVRELRKDAAFMARQKLDDVKKSDAAYKSKIDKIMGQLASQEGAMRGYERDTKKRRRK